MYRVDREVVVKRAAILLEGVDSGHSQYRTRNMTSVISKLNSLASKSGEGLCVKGMGMARRVRGRSVGVDRMAGESRVSACVPYPSPIKSNWIANAAVL